MYKEGDKIRILDTRKIVVITKINRNGVPVEASLDGEIISIVNKAFIIVRLFESIISVIGSIFRKRKNK